MLAAEQRDRQLTRRGRIDPAQLGDLGLRAGLAQHLHFEDFGLDHVAVFVRRRRAGMAKEARRPGLERATQLFAQLARQRGQRIRIARLGLAAGLLEHRRAVLAHQQHATAVVADHRGDDADRRRVQSRTYDQDCGRPPAYGMTPWKGRGSASNTSGRKCRSPSHIGRARSFSRGTHSSVPSGLRVYGSPL